METVSKQMASLLLWENMPPELEAALEIALGQKEGDRQKAMQFISVTYPDFNPFVPRWMEGE